MTTKWMRQRPHWKGVYISKLGRIHRTVEGRWYFTPVPKIYSCKTLTEAKELAEENK